MSIDNYVIGVKERSQRACSLKYDGYKLLLRKGAVPFIDLAHPV